MAGGRRGAGARAAEVPARAGAVRGPAVVPAVRGRVVPAPGSAGGPVAAGMRIGFRTSPQKTDWASLEAAWAEAGQHDVFDSGWLNDHLTDPGLRARRAELRGDDHARRARPPRAGQDGRADRAGRHVPPSVDAGQGGAHARPRDRGDNALWRRRDYVLLHLVSTGRSWGREPEVIPQPRQHTGVADVLPRSNRASRTAKLARSPTVSPRT